jgi:hypothetical protein
LSGSGVGVSVICPSSLKVDRAVVPMAGLR